MQERSERTRRGLLTAAAELIDERGYAEARLSDISQRANVSKGALYFHFTSKEELAATVQESGCEQLDRALKELDQANASSLQTLIDMTHFVAQGLVTDPVMRATLRIGQEQAGKGPGFVDFHARCVDAACSLLWRAHAQRSLHAAVSMEAAEALVASVISGIEAEVRTGAEDIGLSHRLALLWELLMRMLAHEQVRDQLRFVEPMGIDGELGTGVASV
ncbi:ScbR family autoregulator-binding transcription factor [Streptomyces sp. NPDC059176]|uniref:ScbR family autoregulator-binding transcription factor n=1 Tax=Streptomyces sp. NPDC059176 TaxID=3346758 RepID=UPI00368256FB